jgi:chromosome segregation ATPase
MISMAPTLPPVTLTDEAMKLAAALLQIASDPAGTKSRLSSREAALTALQTQLQVASAASAARAKTLDDAQTALDKRIAEHEAKVKANEDRIAQVRASLSA